METTLKDAKFQRLLKEKQRLEILSMTIPFLGIISLLLFLYLFSKEMTVLSIVVLVIILCLIIGQYVFDSIIARKIDQTYLELNYYFQENIIPKLLKKDNPSIVFDNTIDVNLDVIDALDVFNYFQKYNSRFHFEGKVGTHQCIFDEILFSDEVNEQTIGSKELDKAIEHGVHYHFYSMTLNTTYHAEALFVVNGFEELSTEDIVTFSKIDIGARAIGVREELDFSFYLRDTKKRGLFMKDKILNIFREKEFLYHSLIIYVKGNQLYILIEEYESLINTPHSKKFTIEKLMLEYRAEQRLIEKITNGFEI